MRSRGGAVAVLLACACTSAGAGSLPPRLLTDAHATVVNSVPTPFDGPGARVCDAINVVLRLGPGDPGYLKVNADADRFWVEHDALWRDLEGTVALVAVNANRRNRLDVYLDPGTGDERVAVMPRRWGYGLRGEGTPASPFESRILDIPSGLRFGWSLDAPGAPRLFSEAALNPGGWDHLLAYELGPIDIVVREGRGSRDVHFGRSYLLAWEDGEWNGRSLGDEDYDDILYVIGEVVAMAEVR